MSLPDVNDGREIYVLDSISIREDNRFRWLEDAGAMQSIMEKSAYTRLVLPTHQAMCVALALPENLHTVINLGFGSGAIERQLSMSFPRMKCISVDKSDQAETLAQEYFQYSAEHSVVVQDALDFLSERDMDADLIFVDLFADGKNAPCVYREEFYDGLCDNLQDDGAVAINLIPEGQDDLVRILVPLRREFPHVFICQIPDRSNVVVIASKNLSQLETPIAVRVQELSSKFEFDLNALWLDFVALPVVG